MIKTFHIKLLIKCFNPPVNPVNLNWINYNYNILIFCRLLLFSILKIKRMKRAVLIILVLLVVIQFIRPSRNQTPGLSANDITRHYTVPDTVVAILKRACNDCHSNYTRYPWYTNIQPVGWWLQNHINEGKGDLNFSEFGAYTAKRQAHKMQQTAKEIKDGDMPLDSYLWIHKDAILSDGEKQVLINWADSLSKDIAAKNGISLTPERGTKK